MLATVALGLSVSAVVGWPSLFFPIGYDHGTFMYVARVWRDGGLPFRDALDTKPIGIYALHALADLLLGRSIVSFRVLELLCVGFSSLLFVYAAARLGARRRFGIAAHILFVIYYYVGQDFSTLGQVEVWIGVGALGLAALAMSVAQSERSGFPSAVGAGLVAGAIFLLKQNYGLLSLCYPTALLLNALRKPGEGQRPPMTELFARLVVYGLAFSFFFGALVAYFAVQGALSDLMYGMFRLPLLYAKGSRLPPQSLGSYAGTLLWNLPQVVLGLVGIAAAWRVGGRAGRSLVLSGALLFVALSVQRKFWTYHMLVMLPLAVLFVAYGLSRVLVTAGNRGRVLAWMAVVAQIAGAIVLAFPVYGPTRSGIGKSNHYAGLLSTTVAHLRGQMDTDAYYASFYDVFTSPVVDYRLGRRLQQLTRPTETVQVFEFRPSVYIFAERRASHRFFFGSLLFLVGRKESEVLLPQYVELTYRTQRPDWIVFGLDGPWLMPQVQVLSPARHGYRLAAEFDSEYHPHNPLRRARLGIFQNVRR